jgi:NAD(P)-dependent dehydrogenase (short-subunit alcohol dehydrogenase family)
MTRSVLVTGASRGIGRATAERLVEKGWEVYAGVREQSAAPAGTTPVVLDLRSVDAEALRAALPERPDAVVNNAGVVVGGPIEALALDDLRDQLEVNVVGQVAVTQAVLPLLRESRGRIVLISSVSGRSMSPMTGAYSASKYALEAIGDALRIELRPWDVKVVLVEPGAIDTDLWQKAPETLEETSAGMTPETARLYAGHVEGVRKTVRTMQKSAAPVSTVVDAIERALTAQRPRARYMPGIPAKAQTWMQAALPTPLWDRAVAGFTGTPKKGTGPR